MLWQWINQRHNWRNSTYHTMRVKSDTNIERNKQKCSDNDEMWHSQSVINNLPLCCHDVVKIIRGNYDRYFAVVIEEGENLKNSEQNVEIEINYLKKSFGKWVVALRDLDSKLIADLKKVILSVDSKCQYTIEDMWTTTKDHLQNSLWSF